MCILLVCRSIEVLKTFSLVDKWPKFYHFAILRPITLYDNTQFVKLDLGLPTVNLEPSAIYMTTG